ncbi:MULTISPECIES: YajQ family cyclic di-GMP-binding protein [unclassified Schaalia]|uniref:YajQ family cyclic di-GMP-binding protein n=1 Tax=unclassified Schaalia TaxID=2691889 RepID=UPI0015F6DDB3|nr:MULTISPECIES: YajQ family cyclic di-GMP-binding protein [unclassified Schaalia]
MADSSFDVVSKIDAQEVDNAVNQAVKEVSTRYDFRGVDASLKQVGETIVVEANSAERAMAVIDVLQSKLVRRGVSLKVLDLTDREPQIAGKIYRLVVPLKEGIDQPTAKKITKLIRDEGPKGVRAQIQGDEVRVSSKSRNDLQDVIALLKGADLDVALQFVNYR